MIKIIFWAILLLWQSTAQAEVIKHLAQERMRELQKTVALDNKVLSKMRDVNSNPILLTREQNTRYMDLIEKSKSVFGSNPLSPQGYCINALESAHFLWEAKASYEKSKSNFDRATVTRWQSIAADHYQGCKEFISKLK